MATFVFIVFWLVGLVGTFIPVVPATFVIWLGCLVFAYMTGFTVITWGWLAGLAVLALLIMAVDNIASAWGAKKYGGSKKAMIGAIVGSVLGVFMGPLGLIFGPFAGAFVAEAWLNKQPTDQAVRSAFGAIVGLLAGIAGKFVLHVMMGVIVLLRIASA